MAIRIVYGNPGSGKSYYVVDHLLKTFFTEDRGIYVLKEGYCIICNVDGFKPQHIDLRVIAAEHGGYDKFFTVEVQEEVKAKHGQIIYIIDEAQRLFRKDYKNKDVFFWFEYHRHLGQDIYLITQHWKKIPFDVYTLAEVCIFSAPRTRSIAGEFRYHWMDDGVKIKAESLRRRQEVFAQYKSMDMKEAGKISNPVIRSAALALVAFVIILFIASRFMFGGVVWGKNSDSKKPEPSTAASGSAPPAPPGQSSSMMNEDPQPALSWQQLSVVRTFGPEGVGELVVVDGSLLPVQLLDCEIKRMGRSIYALLPVPGNKGGAWEAGREEGSGSSGPTNDPADQGRST